MFQPPTSPLLASHRPGLHFRSLAFSHLFFLFSFFSTLLFHRLQPPFFEHLHSLGVSKAPSLPSISSAHARRGAFGPLPRKPSLPKQLLNLDPVQLRSRAYSVVFSLPEGGVRCIHPHSLTSFSRRSVTLNSRHSLGSNLNRQDASLHSCPRLLRGSGVELSGREAWQTWFHHQDGHRHCHRIHHHRLSSH